MESLIEDFRFAFRALKKSPAAMSAAVVCIGLGIGLNVTIFSVVNGAMLRPFPFADPDRIAVLHSTQVQNDIDQADLSYPTYLDLRREASSFSEVAAFTARSVTFAGLEGMDEPERVQGLEISANLFPLLGIEPVLGRNFLPEEDQAAGPGAVLLSHSFWLRRLNGDPSVLGKTILVNAKQATIVGIMPVGFKFPDKQEAWIPLAPYEHESPREERKLGVYGRLKPGVSFEQATQEVRAFAKRLADAYPASDKGWDLATWTLRREFVGRGMKTAMFTMLGAVSFILLIACANVANLFLARASAREREIAIRSAFGASRGRLVRQLLVESLVVALLGSGLGLLFARYGIRWIEMAIPKEEAMPFWMNFSIDLRVVAFAIAAAFVSAILFGLTPALQATRPNIQGTLREGGRGAAGSLQRNRLRSGLVVGEVALSLVLLIGAALFVRSFLAMQKADLGFDPSQVMTMRFYMPGEAYATDEAKAERVEDVVRRIESLPRVQAVGASNLIPLGGGGSGGPIEIEGQPKDGEVKPFIFWAGVTRNFFQAVGVPVLGRSFTTAEASSKSPVAVVNQAFVEKFYPTAKGTEVVGKRFRLLDDAPEVWVTVVGVIDNFTLEDLDPEEEAQASAYLPYPWQTTWNTGLTIRTEGDPTAITAAARREIHAADPGLPIFDVMTMPKLFDVGMWEYRFFGWLFSIFGAIALLLAAIGVYGVLAFAVSQRRQEIGVRMALGAKRSEVLKLVVGQGMMLAGIGICLGLVGAVGVTRVLKGMLYGISTTDPTSYVTLAVALAIVAFFASFLPARRATEVDPLVALRD